MKGGTSQQRILLSRLKARLEDIEQGAVTCSTEDAQAWKKRLEEKIAYLEAKGVLPVAAGVNASRLPKEAA